jgi:serine/threonine-protein kinase
MSSGRKLLVEPDAAAKVLDLDERYVDEGEIGRGGMASVHRVYERNLGRTVALKALPPEAADSPQRDRFLIEAQINGQLEHPNIVPVYELGADDAGTHYFTMRLIEGRSLTEYLRAHADTDIEDLLQDVLDVFLRVCDALSFAHSRGVIHRDIKPSNIMVGDHGQVYLVDWGIALVVDPATGQTNDEDIKRMRITMPPVDEQGHVIGTFSYMSPEQALGAVDAMDARTDVFGLGAVRDRVLAGHPPFVGDSSAELLKKARASEVKDVTEDLASPLARGLMEVALTAMQRAPGNRFQSVAQLKDAVQQVRRGRSRFPLVRYPAGTLIIEQDTSGENAFYIRSGHCQVFRNETDGTKKALRVLGPGEVFGEASAFTGELRTASVETLGAVELIVVPGEHLAETLGLDSWMGAFVRALGQRFSERSHRVQQLDEELRHLRLSARAIAVSPTRRREVAERQRHRDHPS